MPELKRSLGLVETTLMGVGVMLGAGVYALVGQAANLAGNAVWISFLLASVVASFTGLSYAELSSFIPKAGGEYREPDTPRPFRIPGSIGKLPLIPVFGMLTSAFMLSYVGLTAILLGLAVGVVGLLVYLMTIGRTGNSDKRFSAS